MAKLSNASESQQNRRMQIVVLFHYSNVPAQSTDDTLFAVGIQRGRGLVQQQHRRVLLFVVGGIQTMKSNMPK